MANRSGCISVPDKGRPVAVRTLEFESHKLPVAVSAEDPESDVLDEEEFPFADTLQCVPGLQVIVIHGSCRVLSCRPRRAYRRVV